jgi:putative ABC transport system permease protein
VNLGLVTLKPGADAEAVAARLREIMPADTTAMTRAELASHEVRYWTTRTSTGLVFGFGAAIAFVVGMVILNQILSTQILRQLPQYATLKAIGYTDGHLRWIVVTLALIMATAGYVPSLVLSTGIYAVLRHATLLPIDMSEARMVAVLVIAWGMSAASALIAVRALQRADPVDLF